VIVEEGLVNEAYGCSVHACSQQSMVVHFDYQFATYC
jgi:hypothetical protein